MIVYRDFGLFAVVILAVGLGFIVLKWPEGKHLSFSQHIAKHKHRIIYYNILFTIVLSLLLLFFLGWFIQNHKLSGWIGFFIVMSSIFQYACTIVPETGGRKTYWHRLFAGVSAMALIPVQLLLVGTNSIDMVGRIVTILGLLVMLIVIFLVAKGNGRHPQFLLLQVLYFAAFFIPILWITYL